MQDEAVYRKYIAIKGKELKNDGAIFKKLGVLAHIFHDGLKEMPENIQKEIYRLKKMCRQKHTNGLKDKQSGAFRSDFKSAKNKKSKKELTNKERYNKAWAMFQQTGDINKALSDNGITYQEWHDKARPKIVGYQKIYQRTMDYFDIIRKGNDKPDLSKDPTPSVRCYKCGSINGLRVISFNKAGKKSYYSGEDKEFQKDVNIMKVICVLCEESSDGVKALEAARTGSVLERVKEKIRLRKLRDEEEKQNAG